MNNCANYRKRSKVSIIVLLLLLALGVGAQKAEANAERASSGTPSDPVYTEFTRLQTDSWGDTYEVTDYETTWDCVWFGNYRQGGDTKEPIKWRVLDVNGNDAFLLSDVCLKYKKFNSVLTDSGWETSTIRTWLNADFFNEAFTADEKAAIQTVSIDNKNYENNGKPDKENTNDKVYLLSKAEACRKAYGFPGAKVESQTRIANITNYCKYDDDGSIWDLDTTVPADSWWYRSPGDDDNTILDATDGAASWYTAVTNYSFVRPCLHIDLSKAVWSYAGTVSCKGVDEVDPQTGGGNENASTSTTEETGGNKNWEEFDNVEWIVTGDEDDLTLRIRGEGDFPEQFKNLDLEDEYNIKHVIFENGITSIGQFYGGDSIQDIVIPETVTQIDQRAFWGFKNLEDISISESVIEIGEYAFYDCDSLTSLIIPDHVKVLGEGAFLSCDNLESTNLPKDLEEIERDVFYECKSLKDVSIPKGIVDLGETTFRDCEALDNVIIPDGVTSIKEGLFERCYSLKNIIIADSVTSIGESAFEKCGIESISLPSELEEIGENAFKECSELKKIVTPANVKTIANYAFADCSSLGEVKFSDCLMDIGENAFENCAITNLVIPASVECISQEAFLGCSSLLNVEIKDGDKPLDLSTQSFYNCKGLKKIIFSNRITDIGASAFAYCNSLEEAIIPNSQSGYTRIYRYAFSNCNNLKKVRFPDTLTFIQENVFDGCNNITELIFSPVVLENCYSNNYSPLLGPLYSNIQGILYAEGESNIHISFTDSVTKIQTRVFNGCSRIKEVTLNDQCKTIGENVFSNCDSLQILTLSENLETIEKRAFWGCSGLKNIDIPDSIKEIADSAFYGSSGLTSLVIPDSLNSIGDRAFGDCSGLNEITIPQCVVNRYRSVFSDKSSDWRTALILSDNVTTIPDDTFKECSELISVQISDSVVSIGKNVFEACDGLTEIILPDSITTVGAGTFKQCESLVNVTISKNVSQLEDSLFEDCSNLNGIDPLDNVTKIGNSVFENCTSLTKIEVSDDLTEIGSSAFSGCKKLNSINLPKRLDILGEYAFYNCEELSYITLPNSLHSIEDGVFSGCSNLEYLSIPKNVTTIGKDAFKGCSRLTSITIPEGVISIGSNAFNHCDDVEYITLPKSVSRIGKSALANCDGLTDIYYAGTEDEFNVIEGIGNAGPLSENVTIHYSSYGPSGQGGDNTGNYYVDFNKIDTLVIGKETTIICKVRNSSADVDPEEESARIIWSINNPTAADVESHHLGDIQFVKVIPHKPGNYKLIGTFSNGTFLEKDILIEPELQVKVGVMLNNGNLEEKYIIKSGSSVWCKVELDERYPDKEYLTAFVDKIEFNQEALSDRISFTKKNVVVQEDGLSAWIEYRFGDKGQKTPENVFFRFNTPGNNEYIKEAKICDGLITELAYAANGEKWKDENEGKKDGYHSFFFNDDFFYKKSDEYNNNLAVMSLGLDMTSWPSHDFDNKYIESVPREKNLREAFQKLEFRDPFFYKYDMPLNDSSDEAAFGIAAKTISDGNSHDTLIALVIRGGGYGAEWASNFHVGDDGQDHIGFRSAATKAVEELKSYIETLQEEGKFTGDIKLWIVGYSRGAAVANIAGHIIDQRQLGFSIPQKNIYVYTFATPSGQRGDNHAEPNIFNVVSASDLVPKLALKKGWGFSKYGTTYTIVAQKQNDFVNQSYLNYTGEKLHISDAGMQIDILIDSMYEITPTTNAFVSMAQDSIMRAYKKGYSEHDSKLNIVLSYLWGMISSRAVLGEIIHSDELEILERWDAGEYDDALRLCILKFAEYVEFINNCREMVKINRLTSLSQSHFPEHYLAWLESGGIKTMDLDTYANLTQEERDTINTEIKKVFNNKKSKRYDIHCPVDVEITNSSGEVVASIKNNIVKKDVINCYVEGENKVVYIPEGDSYQIKITGTDNGKMDYTVSEFSEDFSLLRRVQFVDVEIKPDIVYQGDISDHTEDPNETYCLTAGDITTEPSLDTLREIEKPSYILTVKKGEEVVDYLTGMEGEGLQLTAQDRENDSFVQWISEDEDVEVEDCKKADTICRMPAHNGEIIAHYESDHIWNNDYTIDVRPTVNSSGRKSIHCTICGDVKSGSETEIPKFDGKNAIMECGPEVVEDSSMKSGFKSTWGCVWFGSYPQTEIREVLTDAITDPKSREAKPGYEIDAELFKKLSEATNWDDKDDIRIYGIKYHRTPTDSSSESETPNYRYYRYDKIKWRILDAHNGKAFLLSDKCLARQKYNEVIQDVTWETSTLRSWLNGYDASNNSCAIDYKNDNFIHAAFTSKEADAILTTDLNNKTTGVYTKEFGGNNTSDKVFLLSSYDVYGNDAVNYGFSSKRTIRDEARIGYYRNLTSAFIWWLRSPGRSSHYAATVNNYGVVQDSGRPVSATSNGGGVRPAMIIDFTCSNLWSYAGSLSSDDTMEEIADQKQADLFAASKVMMIMDNLSSESDEVTVAEARKAYESLTDAQKDKVDKAVLEKLLKEEKRIDQEKIEAVINMINSIDPAEPSSVEAARKAYESLTEEQKKLIDNDLLNTLVSAENRIKETNKPDSSGKNSSKTYKITASYFPDSIFRKYVKSHFDKNKDGSLNQTEIKSAKEINVRESKIQDLKGIEIFKYLTSLDCCYTHIGKLDISKNQELRYLYCIGVSDLDKLNISKNSKLIKLDCSDSAIRTLDISNNPLLLNCYKSGKIYYSNYFVSFSKGEADLTVDTPARIIPAPTKRINPTRIKKKTVTIKYAKVRKKSQTLKINKYVKTPKAQGKITFIKLSGTKKIRINKKTKKLIVKKGLKRGKYKIKLKVKAAGNKYFKSKSKVVTLKVRVK